MNRFPNVEQDGEVSAEDLPDDCRHGQLAVLVILRGVDDRSRCF